MFLLFEIMLGEKLMFNFASSKSETIYSAWFTWCGNSDDVTVACDVTQRILSHTMWRSMRFRFTRCDVSCEVGCDLYSFFAQLQQSSRFSVFWRFYITCNVIQIITQLECQSSKLLNDSKSSFSSNLYIRRRYRQSLRSQKIRSAHFTKELKKLPF